jgi:tetratricopeptide (TPR) repeat protein
MPREFWERPALKAAFATPDRARWFGAVLRAYHQERRGEVTQAQIAEWLDVSQMHVSRIIRGLCKVTNFENLDPWAQALRIPQRYLWFTLSSQTSDVSTEQAPEPTLSGASGSVSSGDSEGDNVRRRERRELLAATDEDDGMQRRPVLQGILVGAGSALGATAFNNLDRLEQVRRGFDRLLEGSDLGSSTLERWDGLPGEYGRRYQVVAPAHLLTEVASDLVELQYLLGLKLTFRSHRALCRVASQLASLTGIFLAAQGDKRGAQNWFHTAGLAANEAADTRLAGLAEVRSGIVSLYHGAPERALAKLAKAQALLGNAPTPWRARALVAEARAQAMLGRRQEAQRCLNEAEITFGDMPASALGDPALGYTERQFYWTVSNAYTLLGRTAEAEQLQGLALSMYQSTEYLDPALIHLDKSRCLVSQGDVDSACQKAMATIIAVPAEHRGLVTHYGRSLFNGLPGFARATASGRALKELLAVQPASV